MKRASVRQNAIKFQKDCYNPFSGYYEDDLDDAVVVPYDTVVMMNRTKFVKENRGGLSDRLVWGLLIAFLAAVLITAVLTYLLVRSWVASWGKAEEPPAALQAGVCARRCTVDRRAPTAHRGSMTAAV